MWTTTSGQAQSELFVLLKYIEVRGNKNHMSRVTWKLGVGDSLYIEEEEVLRKWGGRETYTWSNKLVDLPGDGEDASRGE